MLVELFNRAFPWKWTLADGKYQLAEFATPNGVKFTVAFFKRDDAGRDFGMAFSNDTQSGRDEYANVGDVGGESLGVFSTVIEVMRKFMTMFDVQSLQFVGDKENNRAKLYAKMIKAVTPTLRALGYTSDSSDTPGGNVVFHLRKAKEPA